MPSLFQRVSAPAARAIDAVMHEDVLVTPMVRGNAYSAPGPDPERDPFTAKMGVEVYEERFADENLSARTDGDWLVQVPVKYRAIHVSPSQVPEALNLREGDRLTLLERGNVELEIVRPDHGQIDRIVFAVRGA